MKNLLILNLDLVVDAVYCQLETIVEEDLVLGGHSESISNDPCDLFEVGELRRVNEQGLFFVIADVDVKELAIWLGF